MTEDLFSQRPRTLRGNKRIKRLSGPPAWRMMRQGKASPRETNQTIVWHSQTFSTVKPGEQEKRWKNSGWSYHLQNHVGMVSEDLIIGMELNFLKTKRKTKEKKKKDNDDDDEKEKREEKGEKEGTKRDWEEGKTQLVRTRSNFFANFFAKSSVATFETVLEQKSKHTTGWERESKVYNTSLHSSDLSSCIRKNSISANPFCSIKQKTKTTTLVWYIQTSLTPFPALHVWGPKFLHLHMAGSRTVFTCTESRTKWMESSIF